MKKVKYLILGGGPAGLTTATRLLERGETSVLLLEKEKEGGGLCRSVEVDGTDLDIGGGHFLDVRRPLVNQFLFRFMPEEEWNQFERNSLISFGGFYMNHPFEANIWQMPEQMQQEYLDSIAIAGCNTGEPMPDEFVPWIYWKLGTRIAEDYMLPYNRKMFGENLNDLGTYWLNKLPNVSFEETKLSCREKHAYGQQPGHASFYYPKKHGYGELWLRMQHALGENMSCGKEVKSMLLPERVVTCSDESTYQADRIITTIPWNSFSLEGEVPEWIQEDKKALRHSSIQVDYYEEVLKTDAHWIYDPNPETAYHRILVRHNFCADSRGYWLETNTDRVKEKSGFSYVNDYAYPLNTKDKPKRINELLTWARELGVYGLGRWGEHEHYNSDAVVELALAFADSAISRKE